MAVNASNCDHGCLLLFQTLAKSLLELLDFEGDIEETFMLNFRIGYKDVFGSNLTHDLKEKGDTIPVTQQNKQVCGTGKF